MWIDLILVRGGDDGGVIHWLSGGIEHKSAQNVG